MLKSPYIVSWMPDRLSLSDGSTHKEFQDHNEAIAFLEDEMKKVVYPIASAANICEFKQKNGKEPKQGQIECVRMKGGVILLYGVSERYIIPDEVKEGVFDV